MFIAAARSRPQNAPAGGLSPHRLLRLARREHQHVLRDLALPRSTGRLDRGARRQVELVGSARGDDLHFLDRVLVRRDHRRAAPRDAGHADAPLRADEGERVALRGLNHRQRRTRHDQSLDPAARRDTWALVRSLRAAGASRIVLDTRDLTITGDETHTNKGNFTQTISGNYELKVTGNLTIDVTGAVMIKGGMSLNNESSGVTTIKGSLVKIN